MAAPATRADALALLRRRSADPDWRGALSRAILAVADDPGSTGEWLTEGIEWRGGGATLRVRRALLGRPRAAWTGTGGDGERDIPPGLYEVISRALSAVPVQG